MSFATNRDNANKKLLNTWHENIGKYKPDFVEGLSCPRINFNELDLGEPYSIIEEDKKHVIE